MESLRSRSLLCLLACCLVWACAGHPAVGDPPPADAERDARRLEFFEARIRPVLVEHCYECHGRDATIAQGNLRLDTRDGVLAGGDSGPAIVPGDPAASPLMQALRYESSEMPPQGKLPDAILDDFQTWIADGAIDPRDAGAQAASSVMVDPAAAASHWAFQRLGAVAIPSASLAASSHPIDRFIEQKLAERGWQPAPPADPVPLLRRVVFDVTGLPPTLEEVDAFLADASPDRYERLVDRLLTSPQYGVRWARHWLDVVRYADSNGADENHDMPNAWRYRDWVVEAMNEDLPFDAFVTQQVAGDLLPAPEDEREQGDLLAATGFWVLGPKMLAEQDKAKMRIDIVDEQIDTFSKSLLGITLSCARCHDHKFDPFTQEDYFAVAGVLMSTRTMADEAFVSKWMERPLPSRAIDHARGEHQQRIDAARGQLEQARAAANTQLLQSGAVTSLPSDPMPLYPDTTRQELEALAKALEGLEKSMPSHDMVMAVEDAAAPVDLPVHVRGNHLRPSELPIPRGVPQRLASTLPMEPIPAQQSGRLQLAHWLTHPDHPLLARVMVNRVWMWHFGQGMVASPSNFGLRGEAPSHPELLDWLAREWIANGWSLKWLHRQILLSDTYRRSARSEAAYDADPENRLLWRQHVRRLEIEPLRDAILQCSDRLDRRLQGPGGPMASSRRTLYLTINRAALHDLFSVFDYVDPASSIEQRPVTNVPSQALFFINSELVASAAEAIAKGVTDHSRDAMQQIEWAFRNLLSRSPSPYELRRSLLFIEEAEGLAKEERGGDGAADASGVGASAGASAEEVRRMALAALVRGLMATREFSWME
jgi:hypothetical protein